ncbi:MAG: glycosyltransferase, partial [Candidatus Lokiarchaeota archaeon]|nr:glycosyltransferase [Candidatus Lokiarchaeota archaeon]
MINTLNVGMLTQFFTPKLGGPYNAIIELVSQFRKIDINTNIYTTSSLSQIGKGRTQFIQKINENLKIFRFDSYLRFKEYRISFKMLPYMLKNAEKIDILHSHALRSFQEDVGNFISLTKHKPMVITPHGGININWDYSDKIPKFFHDKTLGAFRELFNNPHYIAVAKCEIPIIKNYGIKEKQIHYIPHGINTKLFKPVDPSHLRKKYNLEDKKVLLYVGRIAKGKGVDKLIKILNYLTKKDKNIVLFIIGNDSGYLKKVVSLVKKFNLQKYIIFTGFKEKKDLPKYYSLADIVIYPSRQEIFGLVIGEAGACGKPVIGSDILGPSEIIIDGKTGYQSDFNNLKNLSERILELINDKDLLSELGGNARERILKHYSWENAAKLHKELYQKLI